MNVYLKNFGKGLLIGLGANLLLTLLFSYLTGFIEFNFLTSLFSEPLSFFEFAFLIFLPGSFLVGILFILFEKLKAQKLFFYFLGLIAIIILAYYLIPITESFSGLYFLLVGFFVLLLFCGLVFFLFKQARENKKVVFITVALALITLIYYAFFLLILSAMIYGR